MTVSHKTKTLVLAYLFFLPSHFVHCSFFLFVQPFRHRPVQPHIPDPDLRLSPTFSHKDFLLRLHPHCQDRTLPTHQNLTPPLQSQTLPCRDDTRDCTCTTRAVVKWITLHVQLWSEGVVTFRMCFIMSGLRDFSSSASMQIVCGKLGDLLMKPLKHDKIGCRVLGVFHQ
jgi:hypothetical protein